MPLPKCFASTDAPVFARVRFTVCCKVTDWGALDTPSATTPLSAAKTSRWVFSTRLHTFPVIPASWMDKLSSRPRLPGGLASRSCRSRAASMAAVSRGRIMESRVLRSIWIIFLSDKEAYTSSD